MSNTTVRFLNDLTGLGAIISDLLSQKNTLEIISFIGNNSLPDLPPKLRILTQGGIELLGVGHLQTTSLKAAVTTCLTKVSSQVNPETNKTIADQMSNVELPPFLSPAMSSLNPKRKTRIKQMQLY